MEKLTLKTSARTDFCDVTERVAATVRQLGIHDGMVTVFVPHTTAGITINENADPDVMRDMLVILDRLIPWQAGYRHAEGNSAAHAKATLTGFSVQVPVEGGRLALGTWQGLYLCEFDGPRTRQLWISAAETAHG